MRKNLNILILVFSLFTTFIPVFSPTVAANPGVIHVPANYPTIQQAITAANPGDTILVDAGTYPLENLTITKSITLIGASASSTVIDDAGRGHGILIKQTSGVSISQITIENPRGVANEITVLASFDVLIKNNIIQTTVASSANGVSVVNSTRVTIRGNTITGNSNGIDVEGGFSNTIQTNAISTNGATGIFLSGSQGNQVKNNLLQNSQVGLEVWDNSTGNTIFRNNVTQNSLNGVWIRNSNGNLVVQNDIGKNNSTGSSQPTTGVYLENSSGNRFYYNNIVRNARQMLGVISSDITGNSWDDGAPSRRGNFWSDYNGLDNGANGRVAGDGVGDTKIPWPCPNGNLPCSPQTGPAGVDFYPLTTPTIQPALTVAASATPLSGCSVPSPLQVSFNGTAQGGSQPYTYTWRFGDGIVQPGQNQTTHSYSARGILFATMTVNDSSIPNKSGSDILTVISFSGGLSVRVLDDARNPLSGANLTSISQPTGLGKLSQLTNTTGTVLFPCLPPGSYVLQVSHSGFQTLQTTIKISNSTVVQSLALVRAPIPFLVIIEYVGVGAAIVLLVVVGAFAWKRRKRGRVTSGTPATSG